MSERYVLCDLPVHLSFDTVKEKLLLSDEEDIELVRSLYTKAMEIARPKAVYRVCYVDSIDGDAVTIDGITFKSAVMAKNLKDIHRVFAYVATCGTEVDEWSHTESDYFLSLWLDMIKELILGEAVEEFRSYIKATYGIEMFSSMNPGSGDIDVWPIAQQVQLFELIGGVTKDTGTELKDSYLLVPIKSVSGILFPTDSGFTSCELCKRKNCPNRKSEYKGAL